MSLLKLKMLPPEFFVPLSWLFLVALQLLVAEELVALVQTVVVVLMGEVWMLERVAMFVVEMAPTILLGFSLFTANALERVAMLLVVVVVVVVLMLVVVVVPKNSPLSLSLLTANTVPLSAVLPGGFDAHRRHADDDNSLEIMVELNRMRMMRMM